MDIRFETDAKDDRMSLAQSVALTSCSPFRALDHTKEAAIARLTGGLSPAALSLAVADWFIHLAVAPGKRAELASLYAANGREIRDLCSGG